MKHLDDLNNTTLTVGTICAIMVFFVIGFIYYGIIDVCKYRTFQIIIIAFALGIYFPEIRMYFQI